MAITQAMRRSESGRMFPREKMGGGKGGELDEVKEEKDGVNKEVVEQDEKRFLARTILVILMIVCQFVVYFSRTAFEQLIPPMGAELNLTEYQQAAIISGFYYGYTPLQVLGGAAAQVFGSKLAWMCVLGGSGLVFTSLPTLFRWSFTAGWSAVYMMGVFQSPWVPAMSVLWTRWLPKGPESSRSRSIMSLGSRFGRIVANASIPVVVVSYGWEAGLYLIAAVVSSAALMWVLAGASTPKECRYIGATELAFLNKVCQQDDDDEDDDNVAAASSTGGTETSKQEIKQEGALAKLWKGLLLLLKSPAAMSVVFVALSNNWTQVTFDVYAPQYYTSHFNVDAREAGALVAGIRSMGLIMPFAAVWLEEQLTARSISARRVRQLGSGGALSLAACSIIVFASTNTFRVAAAAHVGVVFALSFHTLGYYHGYTEIGGANSGLLAGIGNQIANMAGLVVPVLVVWLKEVTGSWFWSFAQVAVISVVAACIYIPLIQVEPPKQKRV